MCCTCCSVAVLLKVFPYPKNTSIFIYKYRVNFWLSYNLFWNCNTATLQRIFVFFWFWLTVFYFFPDVVDSRFPEYVDNFLKSLTPLLKRLSYSWKCWQPWIRDWSLFHTGKQHKNVMQAIRNMEPAWEKVTGLKFQLCEKSYLLADGVTIRDAIGRTCPWWNGRWRPCGWPGRWDSWMRGLELRREWEASRFFESEPVTDAEIIDRI